MKEYHSVQFTWVILLMVPVMYWMLFIYLFQLGDKPMELWQLLLTEGVFLAIFLNFYELRTTLTDQEIRLSFGIGSIHKTIDIKDIKSTKIVRNPWYYGLGIRLIPNGWLFSAHGYDAVELKFVDKKRVLRIGSQEAEILKNEIDLRMMLADD